MIATGDIKMCLSEGYGCGYEPIKNKKSILGLLGLIFQPFMWDTDWYEKNNCFKYRIGDKIQIANRNAFGYGVDSHGIVVGYCKDKTFGVDKYVIEMDSYDYEGTSKEERIDWFMWTAGRDLPIGCKRKVRQEIHFKSNIELHFERVK